MGNSIEETDSKNTVSGSDINAEGYETSIKDSDPFSLAKKFESLMDEVPDMMEDEISLQRLTRRIRTKKENMPKVKKLEGCIKVQADKQMPGVLDKDSKIRYYQIPYCSYDVPKVHLYDTELSIQPKIGDNEVPPRRDYRSRVFILSSVNQNVIKNSENDIYDSLDRSLLKCESILDAKDVHTIKEGLE